MQKFSGQIRKIDRYTGVFDGHTHMADTHTKSHMEAGTLPKKGAHLRFCEVKMCHKRILT